MKNHKSKRVVFQPNTYQGMQRGINQVVNAIRPTLGPLPRKVAVSKIQSQNQFPEMLDSGGIIARRIIQLPDRDSDTGAMFIRHLLWRQHERVGDGTATTAVLFHAIYREALKFIVAGGNAMVMRRHLEEGMNSILKFLEKMTIPVSDKETITQVAESVCFDSELSKVLGEIFDVVGFFGQVDIRSGRSRKITYEFVGGTVLEGGLHATTMINDQENVRAYLEEPAIFLSDLEIKESEEIIPIIKRALEAGYTGLVIIARTISEKVLGILHSFSQNSERFQGFGVKIPGIGPSQHSAYLEDLAILTGASPYLQAISNKPEKISADHFGKARRVWADKNFLGIFAGGGDPVKIRAHIKMLKDRYQQINDDETLELTLTRLGKLMGGSASLYIGGISETEIEHRKETATWAIGAVRSALLRGVLPGGGAAFLACKSTLEQRAIRAQSLEEKVAYQVLSRAMEEPTRTILGNAGYDPDLMISRIGEAPGCDGFDVRSGKPAAMVQAGILDSAGVLMEAVKGAVSSAALILTVDTLVHRKKPKMADRP